MTILDACLQVLDGAARAMTAREILDEINRQNLYTFGAKDSLKVLSGTIRNNLKNGSPPCLREVEKGRYQLA